MSAVPKGCDPDVLQAALRLLGSAELKRDEIETRIRALGVDEAIATRLVDVVPEAFGVALVSHLPGGDTLNALLSARGSDGEWRDIPFAGEPIFAEALEIATAMFHEGPRALFRTIADRSAAVATVNEVLDAGGSLEGGTLTLRLLGVPAETYD